MAGFLAGYLEPGDAARLETHVARCAACRTLLSVAARCDSGGARSSSFATTGVPDLSGSSGDPWEPTIGTQLGRYVLGSRLGAGAMGVVFAARDPELERWVAVKVLRADRHAAGAPSSAHLLREAQAMARLAHPNVVTVHDVGSVADHIFLAMELVDGQTLAAWLAAERRPLRDVLARFIAAGHGLAAAHAAHLVHRDFKPENVLIGKDGRVRVTDFGVARRAPPPSGPAAATAGIRDGDRTTIDWVAGTPFYMAPEQLAGERADARSDQFSFCVALYAALTGEHPLLRSGDRRLSGSPRRSGLPGWLWRVLRPGLSSAPDQRYPTMDALLARLATGHRRQHQIWLAVGGAALAALATVGAAATRGGDIGPSCDAAPRLMATAWGPERAAAVEQAFRASATPDAAAGFATVSLLLDQHARRWIAMRTEACERAGASEPAAAIEPRIRCLDARLSELRGLTGRLAAADRALIDGAAAAVHALGKLDVCGDDGALQAAARSEIAARSVAAVALGPDRRASAFVADPERSLWQVEDRGDGTRTRAFVVGYMVGRPAIVEDREHALQVFTRKVDAGLLHSRRGPGGAWYTEAVTDGAADDPAAALVAGRLVSFVRRTDGWLWRYWRAAEPNAAWTATRVADVAAGRPGLAVDARGELYAFVRKADGSLWLAHHGDAAQPPDGVAKLLEDVAGDPVAAMDVAGKLTVFVRRVDGSLSVRYQALAGSPNWYGVRLTTGVAGNPAVAADAEGKQVCLIRRIDGSIWAGTQHAPAIGPWHETTLSSGVVDDPTLALDAEGRLVYLVRKTDGTLWRGRQDAPLSRSWHEQVVETGT